MLSRGLPWSPPPPPPCRRSPGQALRDGDISQWDRALQMPHYNAKDMPAISLDQGQAGGCAWGAGVGGGGGGGGGGGCVQLSSCPGTGGGEGGAALQPVPACLSLLNPVPSHSTARHHRLPGRHCAVPYCTVDVQYCTSSSWCTATPLRCTTTARRPRTGRTTAALRRRTCRPSTGGSTSPCTWWQAAGTASSLRPTSSATSQPCGHRCAPPAPALRAGGQAPSRGGA